jgi:hypothetical protein
MKREWRWIWIYTCKSWNWTFIVHPSLYIYKMGLNVIKGTVCHLLGILGLRGLDSKLSTFNLHQYIHTSFMKFNYFNIVEGHKVFRLNEDIIISCNYIYIFHSSKFTSYEHWILVHWEHGFQISRLGAFERFSK